MINIVVKTEPIDIKARFVVRVVPNLNNIETATSIIRMIKT